LKILKSCLRLLQDFQDLQDLQDRFCNWKIHNYWGVVGDAFFVRSTYNVVINPLSPRSFEFASGPSFPPAEHSRSPRKSNTFPSANRKSFNLSKNSASGLVATSGMLRTVGSACVR